MNAAAAEPQPSDPVRSLEQFRASGGTARHLTVFARIVARGRVFAEDIVQLAAEGVDLRDPRP
jgi:hypothetical protein